MGDDWLSEQLERFHDREAMIWRGRPYRYGELIDRVRAWQEVLRQQGVRPGQSVAMHGSFSPGTTTLLVALIANRNVVVPLTTSAASERDQCLEIANAEWLFTFDPQDSWAVDRRDPGEDAPLLEQFRVGGEPGLILFSSGSTGKMKAALHSFARLLANYRKRRTSAYRTLAFLLLDHIGGINTLMHILTGGGTIVSPADRTPEGICRTIQEHRVELLPTTPTFLRMLLISEAYKRHDLSSLELITYGTEPMPAATLESLHQALPGVRLKQTYGLTEVGILPSRSESNDSLWLAVGGDGYETKIVDGILWTRTETAMLGYLNAPSPFDDDGWFSTGDAVEQKGDFLRFLGRKSEIINVGGEKVYPAEVESVIQEIENIKEVTVRGRSNPITGSVVVATVELFTPEDPDALEDRVREACRQRLARFKVPAVVEVADGSLCGERFKKIRNAKGTREPQREHHD